MDVCFIFAYSVWVLVWQRQQIFALRLKLRSRTVYLPHSPSRSTSPPSCSQRESLRQMRFWAVGFHSGVTEVSGAASTGRTSFALSIISSVTQSGAACAWVDVHDALSPESAGAAGIVLERLLWLRTKPTITEQRANTPAETSQHSLPVTQKRIPIHDGGSSHPRNETRGMDRAVSLLFKGEGGLLRIRPSVRLAEVIAR